jgi:hypothetical protein
VCQFRRKRSCKPHAVNYQPHPATRPPATSSATPPEAPVARAAQTGAFACPARFRLWPSRLDEQVGGFGLGRFIVHGAGKKHGETVDLHPELRALVDDVLSTGYLCEAEAAYQSGEISDYFLFPTGKLQRGAYVPLCRVTDKALSDHTLRERFRELEGIAGVEHRKGRAFYGLRRQATDLAPEFAQDAQVLNRISGHSDSATRERIYQDPQNERVRARAAEARRNVRAFLTEADQKKAA